MGKIILQKHLLQVFQLGYFPSPAERLVVIQSLSRVWIVATSWTSARQAPLFSIIFWVQFNPVPQSRPTLCIPMDCGTPGFSVHHKLPEFTQTHVHWVGNALSPEVCSNWCPLSDGDAIQPSHPLSPLLLLPPIPSIRIFSSELALRIKWPKCWNFSIHPSGEYSGMISLQSMDGTLKSLLHHHNLKVSVLQHSAFFMVQLSHLYMTTGETTA